MSEGLPAPLPTNESSGAVNSTDVGRKKPNQGKFRSGISGPRPETKVDTNKHGIRRETTVGPKKTGRKKV